jgi:hypothetical protein
MGFCEGSQGYPIWLKDMPPWLNFSCSLLSIFGSAVMIFFYLYNKINEENNPTRKIILFLSISDFISSFCIFVSQSKIKHSFFFHYYFKFFKLFSKF